MNRGLVMAWITEVVLITYRATKQGGNQGTTSLPLPMPSQYAATFIIYGALNLVPESGQGFAAAVGWGFVAATLLNLYNPVDPTKPAGTKPAIVTPGQTAPNAAGNQVAPAPKGP